MRYVSVPALILGFAMIVCVPVLAQNQPVVERGMKVFADSRCSLCHSVAGKGNAKGVLDNVGSQLSADEIRQWITHPQEMAEKAKATRKPPIPECS